MTKELEDLASKMAAAHCNGWGESVYLAGFTARDEMDNWVLSKDRLPVEDDADHHDEVLTMQHGRPRPTVMKYWELKHCPFTHHWKRIGEYPSPPKSKV